MLTALTWFLDCVHLPIYGEEYSVFKTGSVPILKWNGEEALSWAGD
jgi:hypothetical protein